MPGRALHVPVEVLLPFHLLQLPLLLLRYFFVKMLSRKDRSPSKPGAFSKGGGGNSALNSPIPPIHFFTPGWGKPPPRYGTVIFLRLLLALTHFLTIERWHRALFHPTHLLR